MGPGAAAGQAQSAALARVSRQGLSGTQATNEVAMTLNAVASAPLGRERPGGLPPRPRTSPDHGTSCARARFPRCPHPSEIAPSSRPRRPEQMKSGQIPTDSMLSPPARAVRPRLVWCVRCPTGSRSTPPQLRGRAPRVGGLYRLVFPGCDGVEGAGLGDLERRLGAVCQDQPGRVPDA